MLCMICRVVVVKKTVYIHTIDNKYRVCMMYEQSKVNRRTFRLVLAIIVLAVEEQQVRVAFCCLK